MQTISKIERHQEELLAASTIAWIYENEIVNEMGVPVRMGPGSNYFFLKDIYDDNSKKIVARKPSQFGLSMWAILSEIHDGKLRDMNQIHTLPTLGDVRKFVPSKVDEIIERNPVIGQGMSAMDMGSIGQKQFGSGFVYYTPTYSERAGFIITSDRNWYDELDRSNQRSIKIYASRLEGQDSLKEERWLSTPTLPGFGIDKLYNDSDQKHWRFQCAECKKWQHMKWPQNVDMTKGKYICQYCGKPLDMDCVRPKGPKTPKGTGRWVARFPDRTPSEHTGEGGMSGYWFTQMIAPWLTAKDLCKEYDTAQQEHALDYFYNHKLGMPHISGDSAISAALIMRNCMGNKPHLEVNSCMGVDVQLREVYVTIGNKDGVFVLTSLPTTDGLTKWDRLGQIMEAYDVRYCVIDGGFTPNEVMAFAKKHRGKVWVNWYKDDPKHGKIVRFSDEDFDSKEKKTFGEEVTVLSERDRMIDYVLGELKNGGIRFFFDSASPSIKRLIQHTQTTYARNVTDRLGLTSREWVSTGKDDLLHSLLYFEIARMRQTRAEG